MAYEISVGPAQLTVNVGDCAVGDRVQFTDTAKKLGVYNGNAGTITGLDARTGQVAVRLDAPTGREGRTVTWSAADEFEGFRHGYAGTIYKGQGKTLDHTYLLHTQHWSAANASLASGGELCRADPATRKRAGVRGRGHGPRRSPACAPDGARRGTGRVGCLGHGRRAAA